MILVFHHIMQLSCAFSALTLLVGRQEGHPIDRLFIIIELRYVQVLLLHGDRVYRTFNSKITT